MKDLSLNMKRVFIIHGWGDRPGQHWLPWLKKELESLGFSVEVPAMPDTNTPKIETWVGFLKDKIGKPDSNTYLVGHSIGCQTILRYLETIDSKIGGAVLVAGFVHLKETAYEEESEKDIAKPWLETPIDGDKIKSNCDKFLALFSDNDECVPITDAEIFKEKLGEEVIIEKDKGHYTEEKNITEIPVVLDFFKNI